MKQTAAYFAAKLAAYFRDGQGIPMSYGKQKTLECVKDALEEPESFYKAPCVNWKGTVSDDSSTYYSEVIAEYLLTRKPPGPQNIPAITRNKSYKTSHKDIQKQVSRRYEERFAKKIAKECKDKPLGKLGRAIDYQVPLKDNQKDNAGKIDLVTYDKKSSCVYLVEMKCGKNKETLLRAALEIQTYYCRLNREKFLNDFELNRSIAIKKILLLGPETLAYKEYKESENLSDRPKLEKLLKILDVQIPDCREIFV